MKHLIRLESSILANYYWWCHKRHVTNKAGNNKCFKTSIVSNHCGSWQCRLWGYGYSRFWWKVIVSWQFSCWKRYSAICSVQKIFRIVCRGSPSQESTTWSSNSVSVIHDKTWAETKFNTQYSWKPTFWCIYATLNSSIFKPHITISNLVFSEVAIEWDSYIQSFKNCSFYDIFCSSGVLYAGGIYLNNLSIHLYL